MISFIVYHLVHQTPLLLIKEFSHSCKSYSPIPPRVFSTELQVPLGRSATFLPFPFLPLFSIVISRVAMERNLVQTVTAAISDLSSTV